MADGRWGKGPPGVADRLLRRVLPSGVVGDSIRGDLREEYASLRASRAPWRADLWFWVETVRLVLRAVKQTKGEGMRGWWEDFRIALRTLARSPGFTVITALTLGLGLGANTTIFAVVRSVILRPLPFEEPDRVVAFRNGRLSGSDRLSAASFPQFLDLQRETETLEPVGGWRPWNAALTPDDGTPPARIESAGATHEIFRVLGLQPRIGRVFTAADERRGAPKTAIVSDRFWRGVLGSDPAVLGRPLRLNGESYAVVGVLPELFRGQTDGGGLLPPATVDVWVPFRNSPVAEGVEFRGLSNVSVIGRIEDGVAIEDAQGDIDRIMSDLASTYTEHEGDRGVLISAPDAVVGDVRAELALLMGAVGLVLLLACVNAAGLILGRAESRVRELAVRRALGAGRSRLLRLLLAESTALALLGSITAALIAGVGLRLLRLLDPGTLPRLGLAAVDAASLTVLGITAAAVALVLGVVPAWSVASANASASLRRSQDGLAPRRLARPALVVAQVALAAVLLSGAGLLVRSLNTVLGVEPGFEPTNLLTARVDHPTPFVSDEWPEHVAFFRAVVETLERESAVLSVAAAYQDPADPGWNNSFRIAGQPEDAPLRGAIFRPVSPGYFATAGIPFVAGRDFDRSDDESAPGVAIVNETFARRYFPDEGAIGRRVDYGDFWLARDDPEYEIVGVVGDVRFAGAEQVVPPAIYFPHAQQPVKEMAFVIRTSGDPTTLVPRLREIVADLNPSLPVYDVTTIEAKLAARLAERRFLAVLLGSFALLALALAAVGLYGVLSYLVTRRTREIGIRLAIGAQRESVLNLVLRQGMALVGLGLLLGIPASLALSRLIRGLLFQVAPVDPATYVSVPVLLTIVGLLACSLPALRATRVDPLRALGE